MTDKKELNTSRGDEIDSARLEEWTSNYIDEYYKDIPDTILKNSDDRKDKK